MRNVIFKYTLLEPLPLAAAITELKLPANAWVLSAKEQDGEIRIWALIDLDQEEREIRKFLVQGTGHQINTDLDDLMYLDTVKRGSYVWHVFEIDPVAV